MKLVVCRVFLAFLVSGQTIPGNVDSFSSQMQVKLDQSQMALVDDSKQAIIATGISEAYFNVHFTLLRVFNQPSDRRVIWKFVVNGYEAIISDSIGFTSVGAIKTDIHSVSRSLGQLSEITRTVPRSRAFTELKRCIGDYFEPYVELGQVEGRAELLLVGTQKPKQRRYEQNETLKRERKEGKERSLTRVATDVIENDEGEKSKAPAIFGYINLQTGKCMRGKGVIAKEGQ